jgi:hypothetical protein
MDLNKRVIRFFRKGLLSVFSVMLHRGGSGGGVIESVPSQKWLKSMALLQRDGYMAYMRIIIDPSARTGYGDYPEFRLIFLPGNHRGIHEPTINPSSPISVWEDNDLTSLFPCAGSDAFIINTSLGDLENLHKTLGKAIRNAKRAKAKKSR